MTTIIVRKEDGGYAASVKDRPELNGYGKSAEEAVGSLVKAHWTHLNIEVIEP